MTRNINRREFLKKGALASLGAFGGLSMGPRPVYSGQTESLRIGYLPILDATPLLVAHARGYYKDEGLKVDKPVRVRSWSTLSESFLTGKFNATHLLLPIPVWMRYKNKVPVKILAWNHTNGSALTVRGDRGINSFGDLGGTQIAVPFWYSMHNIILQMGIRKAGLTPVIQSHKNDIKPNQVNLFVMPPPEMPVALLGKKIDGYIVAEPFNAIGEMKIKAKIMRFTGDMWKNHPCCVVVMNEKYTAHNPVFTQKFINALVRAQLWATNNLEETAHILSRDGGDYLPVTQKILTRALTGYEWSRYGESATPQAIKHREWGIDRVGFQPYPFPSATRLIVDEMKKTLVEGDMGFLHRTETDLIVKDLVNDTFVKSALKNVGGPEKFELIDVNKPWEREEIVEL